MEMSFEETIVSKAKEPNEKTFKKDEYLGSGAYDLLVTGVEFKDGTALGRLFNFKFKVLTSKRVKLQPAEYEPNKVGAEVAKPFFVDQAVKTKTGKTINFNQEECGAVAKAVFDSAGEYFKELYALAVKKEDEKMAFTPGWALKLSRGEDQIAKGVIVHFETDYYLHKTSGDLKWSNKWTPVVQTVDEIKARREELTGEEVPF